MTVESLKVNVYLYYPSRILGGAEVLFSRVARSLRERGLSVIVFDFPNDGIYLKLLEGSGVQIVNLGGNRYQLGENDILIMPPVGFDDLQSQIIVHPHTKFLFWVIHPYNFVKVIPGLNVNKQYASSSWLKVIQRTLFIDYFLNLKGFLRRVNNNGGLYFMDQVTCTTTESLFSTRIESPKYLPIPVDTSNIGSSLLARSFTYFESNTITFAWVSRLADFKVSMLKYVIEELCAISPSLEKDIKFMVIGAGEKLSELKQFCLKLKAKEIEFEFLGEMEPRDLKDYLEENVDCLFAMGTSALEGGAVGVPTVLVDGSYKKVKSNYRYKWLNETKGFSLGYILNGRNLPSENVHTMPSLLESLITNAEEIENSCRDYVFTNHSIKSVTDRLIKALCENRNHFSVFQSYIQKPAIFRLYSKVKLK